MALSRYAGLLFLWLMTVTATPVFAAEISAQRATLEVASIDYPPLMGRDSGVMTDVVKAAFATQGVVLRINIVPISDIVHTVIGDKQLPIVGSVDWFPQRDRQALPSVRIYSGSLHFFYLKRRFPAGLRYESLSELDRYAIGYVRGGSLIPLFTRAGLRPELVSRLEQNVKKVYADRIDMFAAIDISGWAVLSQQFAGYEAEFEMHPRPLHTISGDVVFPESKADWKVVFEKGLREIQASGEFIAIFKHYYGNRPLPKEAARYDQ